MARAKHPILRYCDRWRDDPGLRERFQVRDPRYTGKRRFKVGLKALWRALDAEHEPGPGERGRSLGHLSDVAHGKATCGGGLALALDRLTGGEIPAGELLAWNERARAA